MGASGVLENIATGLSTLTILSCMFLKVPQIMFIREKMSAEGIYLQAMVMEVTGFTIMTLYNFTNGYAIMTYLEYPIILLQVYVMFYYVLKYKCLLYDPVVPAAAIMYFLIVICFATGLFPKVVLSYVVPFCTPMSGFVKVTYMYGIIQAENADAVSLTTWMISVLTNSARIFTVYVDSYDISLIANFFISTLLSGGVLSTAMYYQNYKRETPPPRPRRKSNASCRRHSHLD